MTSSLMNWSETNVFRVAGLLYAAIILLGLGAEIGLRQSVLGAPDPMCFSQAEGATGNAGWYRHEAGQLFDCGRSNQNIDRVAAIVLDCGMLSPDSCEPDPQGPGGTLIYQVRLTQ